MALQGVTYTLDDLVSELNTRMDDASNDRWTESQKQLSVQLAVSSASPRWWEERIDDKHTYDYQQPRYELPPGWVSIEEVRFEPIDVGDDRHFVVPSTFHIEGNELVFEKNYISYNDNTLYIIYTYYPRTLLDVSGTSGEVQSDGVSFVDSSATFITDGVKAGDAIVIEGDGRYIIQEVTFEDEVVLRTEAEEDTGLTYYIAYYTDIPKEYLLNYAMSEMYMMATRNRPGVEIESSIRLSNYHRQLAIETLEENRMRGKSRRRY